MLTTQDYRSVHLDLKGQQYEERLAASPLEAYLMAREAKLMASLVPRLFPGGVPRYLDFACGTGRITQLIEPLANASYGLDISPTMLELARRRCPRTTFLECDVTRQNPGLEPVQLVTAFRFFGNAQDALRREALRTLADLVAPGGYLVLNSHRNPRCLRNLLLRLRGQPLSGCQGRPMDLHYGELRRLLAGFHFRVVRTQGIGFWIFRAALEQPTVLNSRVAAWLEAVCGWLRPLAPFCPDAIVVAQRVIA